MHISTQKCKILVMFVSLYARFIRNLRMINSIFEIFPLLYITVSFDDIELFNKLYSYTMRVISENNL